ncbi:MAG: protein translocase subunit SecF [Sphaerochaetaceae bacterium]|jgi:preprotein translocase subunit SecF
MANKKVPVIKFRFYAVAMSLVLLAAGIVAAVVFGGFNTGIDFDSGLSQRIQIAPVGLSVSYSGNDDATLSISGDTLVLEVRGASGVATHRFASSAYPTSTDLVKGLNDIDKIDAVAVDGGLLTRNLLSGFGFPAKLSAAPKNLNFSTDTVDVSINDMRDALASLGNVKVQTVGSSSNAVFQVRLGTEEGDTQASMEEKVSQLLGDAFGADEVVILQNDFVGPKFSSSLVSSSVIAVLIAMALIMAYVWIRFRFAYAVSALVGLFHDVLLLLSFILVFQLEISSTTIAAVLTIIGYSLNNTIVIFDRIRENVGLNKESSMPILIDMSVTQSLRRTTFSSLTTILAILPLAIMTSGDIRLFAIELVFGVVVGTYSSNFISPAFLYWINKAQGKKNGGKGPDTGKESLAETSSVVDAELVESPKVVEIPVVERKLKGKRQQKK